MAGALVKSLRDTYWDGRAVPLPPWASTLGWIVVGAVYVPAVGLAVWRLVVWGRRLARRDRPWREPLDLVVLAFWFTVALQLLTWFGTSGVIRYSLTFFGPLPLLVAAVLARLASIGRAGRGAAVALAGALIVFNVVTHVAFVQAGAGTPVRPVDTAIAKLDALGVTACYADSRIAQVISFESTERVVCADFHGLRDYAALRTVDHVEEPETVAIVTHRVMRSPEARQLAAALARIGATWKQTNAGDYVIFHHFVPPDPRTHPVPTTGWRARASFDPEEVARAYDRQAWTRWAAPERSGQWFELDLGQIRPIAQVSLLSAPWSADAPAGLRVETSVDGQSWEAAATEPDLLAGLHWWKGHPRLDDSGRVVVRFAPRQGRYVRLTHIGSERPGGWWSITELFVYETAASPWPPPPAAAAALDAAARELDHWMDDPTGPHPLRAPSTYEHRRAQVRWRSAFAATNQALAAAPEWEEAHALYGWALARAVWGQGLERTVDRARSDGAWLEVIRAAELIDAQPDATWRAAAPGRLGRGTRAIGPASGGRRGPRPAGANSGPVRSDPLRQGARAVWRRRATRGPTGGDGAPHLLLAAPGAHRLRLLGLSPRRGTTAPRREPRRPRGQLRVFPLDLGRARPPDRHVHGPSGHSAGHLPGARRRVAPVHRTAPPHPGVGRPSGAPRGLARVPRRRPLTRGHAFDRGG